MKLKIAEVDRGGIRGDVHRFTGVTGFTHEDNRIHISFKDDEQTFEGDAQSLDVVSAEVE